MTREWLHDQGPVIAVRDEFAAQFDVGGGWRKRAGITHAGFNLGDLQARSVRQIESQLGLQRGEPNVVEIAGGVCANARETEHEAND